MVDELADGPAARTIRRVELRGRESRDGGREARGRLGDRVDALPPLLVRETRYRLELANRVAQIGIQN
jgi:hypothetical protein